MRRCADYPAPRQDDEALGGRGTSDDVEGPSAELRQDGRQLVADGITTAEITQPLFGRALINRKAWGQVPSDMQESIAKVFNDAAIAFIPAISIGLN